MMYKNKIILDLDFWKTEQNEAVFIENCIIDKLGASGHIFEVPIKITNCIIREFVSVGGCYNMGLTLSNCIITDIANFEAGGHNKNGHQIIIEDNVFTCFVSFFDCHYNAPFIFRNNILPGSNLLGNKGKFVETRFKAGSVIENNIGHLEYNEYDPPYPNSFP